MSSTKLMKLPLSIAVLLAVTAMMAFGATQASAGYIDTDADGSSDRCELQSASNPAVADTDLDGIADGAEDTDADGADNRAESTLRTDCGVLNTKFQTHRGTVTSYDAGVLTVTLSRGGGVVVAPVATDFKCLTNRASSKSKGKNKEKSKATASKKKSKLVRCSSGDLVAGAKVHGAKIRDGKFVKIQLTKKS